MELPFEETDFILVDEGFQIFLLEIINIGNNHVFMQQHHPRQETANGVYARELCESKQYQDAILIVSKSKELIYNDFAEYFI